MPDHGTLGTYQSGLFLSPLLVIFFACYIHHLLYCSILLLIDLSLSLSYNLNVLFVTHVSSPPLPTLFGLSFLAMSTTFRSFFLSYLLFINIIRPIGAPYRCSSAAAALALRHWVYSGIPPCLAMLFAQSPRKFFSQDEQSAPPSSMATCVTFCKHAKRKVTWFCSLSLSLTLCKSHSAVFSPCNSQV